LKKIILRNMQLELLKIHYRFLAKPTNIIVTLAGSKKNDSGQHEEIHVEVVIEREAKEDLLALSLSEIREEALKRAKILLGTVE
jgi:hypothetical protein